MTTTSPAPRDALSAHQDPDPDPVGRRRPLDRADTAERLQALIPGARLSYLPDAGHFAMLDTPNVVAEKIAAFLGALQP